MSFLRPILVAFALMGFAAAIEETLPSKRQTLLSSKFHSPNYTFYHKSESLLEEVRALALRHSDSMKVEERSLSRGGYSATLTAVHVKLGSRGASAWAPWGHPSRLPTPIRALLVFGQHGREPVTSEIALRLLQLLSGEVAPTWESGAPPPLSPTKRGPGRRWGSRSEASASSQAKGELLRLLDSLPPTQVTIVPIENVQGRRRFEGGNFCDRRNGRGVDLNRNWALDFGAKEKDYDPAEEFPGAAPFSEPEAELVRRLAVRLRPQVWVNVHSGMEALFVPFDHRRGGRDPLEDSAMRHLVYQIHERFCRRRCTLGSGGGSVGYFAHGTATDWIYAVLRTPLAFTFEVFGDPRAHQDDCFRAFNPTSQKAFEEVVSTWSEALVSLLFELPETLARLPLKAPALQVFNNTSVPQVNVSVLEFPVLLRLPVILLIGSLLLCLAFRRLLHSSLHNMGAWFHKRSVKDV